MTRRASEMVAIIRERLRYADDDDADAPEAMMNASEAMRRCDYAIR